MNTVLICAGTGHFADDVEARCEECGASVVHRPHVPPDATKLCAACGARWLLACETPPELRVTDDTLRDVALFYAKTKGTQ